MNPISHFIRVGKQLFLNPRFNPQFHSKISTADVLNNPRWIQRIDYNELGEYFKAHNSTHDARIFSKWFGTADFDRLRKWMGFLDGAKGSNPLPELKDFIKIQRSIMLNPTWIRSISKKPGYFLLHVDKDVGAPWLAELGTPEFDRLIAWTDEIQ